MLRDCIYDLQEIRQCRDCYRVSNEKTDKHWFCQPCRPPHQLVYAKQKGFPYWPAKVRLLFGAIELHTSHCLLINCTQHNVKYYTKFRTLIFFVYETIMDCLNCKCCYM